MNFPLVSRISFLLLFLFMFEGISCGQDLWDKANLEDRRLAHKRLFDKYVKDKKCVFSQDKLSLYEVVIYDVPTKFTKSCEIKLPQGTRDVSRNFNQLVVRGKSLSGITVSLGVGQNATSLQRVHGTVENLAVFKLVNVTRPNSIKDGMDENREFDLQVRCKTPATIEEISLRFKGDGISKDFESQQKKFVGFDQGRTGKVHEEFFRTTSTRSFDELANSLSEKSEAFSRIILPASFGAGVEDYKIKGVLADRRVSKLYEGLSRMEPNVAEQVAKELFANAFESYSESFRFVTILPSRKIYGPQAHLLLCSEFCSPEVTLEQIERWDTWHAANLKNGIPQSSGLDKIFSMNLQINVIRKKNNWSIQRVNKFLATEFGPSFKIGGNRPPTVEWSALRSSDWTPKQIEVLSLVPVFSHTSALSNPKRHEFILETLRNELLDHN
jgi:hypothetical protein